MHTKLVSKPEGNSPYRRNNHRREYNIKMNVRQIRCSNGLHFSDSEYGKVASSCEDSNELSGAIKGGNLLRYLSNY
jgi:hypothetical protein